MVRRRLARAAAVAADAGIVGGLADPQARTDHGLDAGPDAGLRARAQHAGRPRPFGWWQMSQAALRLIRQRRAAWRSQPGRATRKRRPRRKARTILAILAGVTIVAAAGWGAGAGFQSPRGGAWRALSVACWLALAGARCWPGAGTCRAALAVRRRAARPAGLVAAGVRPSNARSWMPEVARTTCGDIDGDRVTLHDVRDFDWRTRSDYDVRWRTETSVASGIGGCRAVVLGRPAIAHALVSFGFGDGRHVVFSVEVRRKLGDAFSEIGASSASTSCRCWRPPKRTACGYAPMCAARTVTCIACTCPRAGARVVPGLCRDGQRAGASTALLQHADRQLHHHRVPAGPAHRARAADGLPAAAVRLSARIPVPHRRAARSGQRGPIATPAAIPTARAPRPTRRSSRAISARACPANEEGFLAACRLPRWGSFHLGTARL